MKTLRSSTSYATLAAAFGLALIAGTSGASAQTYVTSQPATTITTVTRTVRTVPVRTWHPQVWHRQVITTHTVTQRVAPATTVINRSVAANPQPLYDQVTPAPAVVATSPDYAWRDSSRDSWRYRAYGRPLYDYAPAAYDYSRPLYDTVAATPSAAVIDNGSVLSTQPYLYRYVYLSDRILVIDPATGDAIQTIPR
jgi:hypothetical protein